MQLSLDIAVPSARQFANNHFYHVVGRPEAFADGPAVREFAEFCSLLGLDAVKLNGAIGCVYRGGFVRARSLYYGGFRTTPAEGSRVNTLYGGPTDILFAHRSAIMAGGGVVEFPDEACCRDLLDFLKTGPEIRWRESVMEDAPRGWVRTVRERCVRLPAFSSASELGLVFAAEGFAP